MNVPIRQSTASQEILLGPFLDDTDGKTAETALSIANTDIKIWKCGGTTEASKNSGGATHIASGRYYAVLDATDTNTLGAGEINVHVSGALPIKVRFTVLPAVVYDSLVLDTDQLNVNMAYLAETFIGNQAGANFLFYFDNDDTVTTRTVDDPLVTIVDGGITAAKIAPDAIGSSELDASAVTEIQSGLATAAAVAALNNLSSAQAQTAAAAAITAAAIPTAIQNADALLGRSVANVENTAAEWSLGTLIMATFESSVVGTTWTIKKTDGSTTMYTKTLTKTAGDAPIRGVT